MEVIQRNHPKRKDGEHYDKDYWARNKFWWFIEEEIDNLTSDNNNLKSELTKWKNKFLKIINFIKNKLLRPKDKDKYKEFTIDLYTHNALDQETFDDIKKNYSKDKREDDFER